MNLRVVVVSGSHRVGSRSILVSEYVRDILRKSEDVADVSILDLCSLKIPFWDEGFWDGEPDWMTLWEPISSMLVAADAFVIVAPEWAGTVPPGLVNFFALCSPSEVGHKPAMIVTVSAGRGGAYPVSYLRSYSYKNNKICYVPDHVVLRGLGRLSSGIKDEDLGEMSERLQWSLTVLKHYALSMRAIRQQSEIFDDRFENGM